MHCTLTHILGRSLNTVHLALLVMALLVSPALAAEGDLDATFGTNGEVSTDVTMGQDDEGFSVALQDDGKIVVAGYSDNGSDLDFALARYKSDGTLDTTFGVNGLVTKDISSGNNDKGLSVALQDDGKIVVAGYSDNGSDNDFALARYKSNGALDTTFGTNGIVITDVTPGNDDEGYSVVLQDDGKIVVAGYSDNGSDLDLALARYKSNGTLDTTFGTNGIAITDVTPGNDDEGNSVALQDDGKIVVAGYSDNGSDDDFALARYKSDGTLDTTFGANGLVTTDLSSGSRDEGKSVALQADGKIVVAGIYGATDIGVARYMSDGSLDTSFDNDGYVVSARGMACEADSIALQDDGKIVVAGTVFGGVSGSLSVARYLSDGSLDTSFDDDGWAGVTLLPDSAAYSLVIQDDKKIVVVGASDKGDEDFALARFIGDEIAPEVSDVTPTDGATDQDVDTTITAEFNEEMDDATLTETSFTLSDNKKAAISGTMTYDDDTATATFTPDSDLTADTTYTATLSTDITDKAGNALADDYSWSFTTSKSGGGSGSAGESESSSGSSGGGCTMTSQGNTWLWLPLLALPAVLFAGRGFAWKRR